MSKGKIITQHGKQYELRVQVCDIFIAVNVNDAGDHIRVPVLK
jgi:methyl coenzyme M reductase subunit D